MKKILLSSAITMLLTVSTMAQADNSSVAVDSLGLPSSALLLTDTESDNTRGTSWREFIEARADYRAAKCNKAANRSSDKCLDLYFTKQAHYDNWQYWKAEDIANPGDNRIEGSRSYSY